MDETVTVDDGMEIVFSRVAGLDIGKRELAACVRVPDKNGRFRSQTKMFSTTPWGLLELDHPGVVQDNALIGVRLGSDDAAGITNEGGQA